MRTRVLGALRVISSVVVSLAFWTLWLVLSLVLAAQVFIASTNELELPAFVQRALLDRLAISGVHISFGHTLFDPSGRILIENAAVTLDGFDEPLATARAIYLRINPWALAAERFEPREVTVTGMNLRIPAMFSASGRADEIIQDLDAAVVPGRDAISIERLHCHVGNLAVSAVGGIRLRTLTPSRDGPLPAVQFMVGHYVGLIRRCASAVGELADLDRPALWVRLEPSDVHGAIAHGVLMADALKLTAPRAVDVAGLRVLGQWPILGDPPASSVISISAARVDLPGSRVAARGVDARITCESRPDRAKLGGFALALKAVMLDCAEASVDGANIEVPVAVLKALGPDLLAPSEGGDWEASVEARGWGEPIRVQTLIDPRQGAGRANFRILVEPALLDFVGSRLHQNLTASVKLTKPVLLSGEARFGPGWKFDEAQGWLEGAGIVARGVTIDEVRGRVRFDGAHLHAEEAYARLGENHARGTYDEDMGTLKYRFILDGVLRPLDIAPWIAGDWWNSFFGTFAFPLAPPAASMDLSGCWIDGRQARVYVVVDSGGIVIHGSPFDRVRLTLFTRPQFDDGISLEVTRGGGSVRGVFARRLDNELGGDSASFDFDMGSNMDLAALGQLIGAFQSDIGSTLAPFSFSQAPDLKVSGHLPGPQAPAGSHEVLHIDAASPAPFRYYGFPLEGVSFAADVLDDEVVVSRIKAGFAGGVATGNAKSSGVAPNRRLSFSGSVSDAFLDRTAVILNDYLAVNSGKAPSTPSSFLAERSNVRLSVTASAQGRLDDLFSYQGSGNAQLQGAGLGEVRMFGRLSDLLRFTSLRFTSARANFKVNGSRLDFPEVSVTGAHSAITGHGTYALDRGELDFIARVNLLKEGKALPEKFLDAVLAPLADVFEVKLKGKIDKPEWMFANGPANFLHNLTQPPATPSPLKN